MVLCPRCDSWLALVTPQADILTPGRALQVKLRSSDNEMFEVPEDVAYQSLTIKNMIEGGLPRSPWMLNLLI